MLELDILTAGDYLFYDVMCLYVTAGQSWIESNQDARRPEYHRPTFCE